MINAKRLISGSQLTASAATYYTAPANTKAIIKRLTLTNTSANAVTATVYLVPSAGTAGNDNTIISARTLAAGETYVSPEAAGQVLEAAGTIQALAGSATSITIAASGLEVT